jgi:hypothetical protein
MNKAIEKIDDILVANIDNNEDILIIRNFINKKNEIILNRQEAAILLVELFNFLSKTKNKP